MVAVGESGAQAAGGQQGCPNSSAQAGMGGDPYREVPVVMPAIPDAHL